MAIWMCFPKLAAGFGAFERHCTILGAASNCYEDLMWKHDFLDGLLPMLRGEWEQSAARGLSLEAVCTTDHNLARFGCSPLRA